MSLLSPPLEAFWAITRKGTVQDASKILGITQTGVTQRIRSLEKQLKTTLFIRSRKGMKLTAEGEALLQYVKGSLEIEGMALSKIQRAAQNTIIEVGISGPSSVLRSRVIPNLLKLKSSFPLLRYRFDLSDTESNVDKLKTGFCDFAVLDEANVLALVESGQSNQQIAQSMAITVGTTKSHLHRAYEKLDARNRLDAVAKARSRGHLLASVNSLAP